MQLKRTGAAWEPTENPRVTRYYDTDDDEDFIEVEELSLDGTALAALRAADVAECAERAGRPRSRRGGRRGQSRSRSRERRPCGWR